METYEKLNFKLSPEYIMGGFTSVDNIFVCEYLKNFDGDTVKVYLYCLYLAHSSTPTYVESLCERVDLSFDDVLKCLDTLENESLIEIRSKNPLDVCFHPISSSYSKPRKIKPGKYKDFNSQLQGILTSKMLSPNDFLSCYSLLENYHFDESAFLLISAYCVELKGKNISLNYILATARDFAHKKLTTLKAVESELENFKLQSSFTSKLLKALNIKRQVVFEDTVLLKKWFEMGFEEEAILTASKLVKGTNAGIRKLDSFILDLFNAKKFSVKDILDFDKNKKNLKDIAVNINNKLSIFVQSLDAEINTYITKWQSFGFSTEVLYKVAEMCFINNRRTLNEMDFTLEKFVKIGVITEDSFNDYVRRTAIKDKTIAKLLELLNIERKVNSYDRKNFNTFEKMGFTDELIFYAGELALDANNPYPYMNAILVKWKNANIFSLDEAKNFTQKSTATSTSSGSPSKAKDMPRYEYTEDELNSLYASLDEIEL